jgi:hypothetical protein
MDNVVTRRTRGKTCVWSEDSNGIWDAECGQTFCLHDGTPSENGMRYCCYCGKTLREQRYISREDEEMEDV